MSDDFVYVDFFMTYNTTLVSGGAKKQLASQTITRTSPIVDKPSDYYGAISKSLIDSYDAPLFVPLIKTGQSNPNLTQYCFQLGYNGVYSDPEYVIFTSNNGFEPTPLPPLIKQDISSTYYYQYNYSEFLYDMNTAIANALINLNSKVATGMTLPPVLYFDPTIGIVYQTPNTSTQNKYYQPQTTTPEADNIQLYFNDYVAPLLNGIGASLVNNGQICQVMLYSYDVNYTNGTDKLSPANNLFYKMTMQNLSQTCYWNVLKTIYLNTNMPVSPEYIQAPINSKQPQNQTNITLFDLSPDSSDPTTYSNTLVYNKVDSLRLFEFTSDTPLYNINLTLNFTDNYGRQFPMYLSPGIAHHIKLEFIKKDVYNKNNKPFSS